MKFAVMGSGGIGGYVGGRLAEAGESVAFVARGRHLEAMRRHGLRIESPFGDVSLPAVTATDDVAAIGPVDVVIFAVKLGDTDAAARALAPLIGATTRIVTLQNGIDGREMIARHVAAEKIATGSIYISAHIREPGVIASPGGARRMMIDRLGGDAMIGAFLASCERLIGLDTSGTDAIAPVIWRKFVTITAFAGITCLVRLPIGAIFDHPESAALLGDLVEENVAVAQAAGHDLGANAAAEILALFRGVPGSVKSSMLVDLEAGRPLELPWLSGRVLDLARAHGIDTPGTRAVVAALAPHVNGSGARR